jgi:hypothetical protein
MNPNCPHCGCEFITPTSVNVYSRREDMQMGLHVAVEFYSLSSTATIDDLAGNPSPRRSGVTITFACEGCHRVTEIDFAQHKGETIANATTGKHGKFALKL